MTSYADLEISIQRIEAGQYVSDFRFTAPSGDTDTRIGQGQQLPTFSLDLTDLGDVAHDRDEYSKLLSSSFFASPELKSAFTQAVTGAQAQDANLRLRLMIGPNAPELHAVRWELLRNPQDDSLISTNQNIVLSRYLSSMDWRPVRLRPKGSLTTLIAIANPKDLGNYKLAPIDVDTETQLAREGMSDLAVNTCPGTLTGLINALQEKPIDVLYLVCHGYIANGQPILCLEDAQGNMDKVSGQDFVIRLKELQERPRLILLVSCQSAGKGTGETLAAIGPRLAEIGISAVLAMQDNLSMSTAKTFFSSFFNNLKKDGFIDRAVSAARGEIRDAHDFWVPALFMRLRSGRLWYTPGFGGPRGEFEKWPSLQRGIQSGRCTPIIGPGLNEFLLGPLRDTVHRWADSLQYPLGPDERESLPQVAQFRTVDQSRFTAEDEWFASLRDSVKAYVDLPEKLSSEDVPIQALLTSARQESIKNGTFDPYQVLAQLPVKVYITANADQLLEDALREAGKEPITMVCPWREFSEETDPGMYVRNDDMDPSAENPLVYHLFGLFSEPESLVLTEDETFEFLIGITRHMKNIPDQVGRALSDSALLFLGFNTDDWNFRILLQALLSKEGNSLLRRHAHIAAQIEPEEGRLLNPTRARRYLEAYFARSSDIEINIFWGSAREFMEELTSRIKPKV